MSLEVSRLLQPGHVNARIKPSPLMLHPGSNQVYFKNGLPCRCRLEIPVEPDLLLDYLAELDFDQLLCPLLEPGLYQVGFERIQMHDLTVIFVRPIATLSSTLALLVNSGHVSPAKV